MTVEWTPEEQQEIDEWRAIRKNHTVDGMPIDQWYAIRKEAGLKIDPETAEVDWLYAQTLDPYGVEPELPPMWQQIGREYFARAPGSDIWVEFGDLPDAVREALWKKHRRKIGFPAGLVVPPDAELPF